MEIIIEVTVWPETPPEERLDAKIATLQYNGFRILDIYSRDAGLKGTRYFIKYEPTGRGCPICGQVFPKADDTARHLEKGHGWDDQRATLWLRNRIEEEAFYDPE